ncbi:putative serine/threonine-protein kinase PRKY [Hylaeus volcanicus]|uniref:putative serine/threonine-protein kinase PRKY n=1 Tax=Hylaeus volcanicus TaxID=313075 RepID=UPI0023B7AD76|nr:putative serine/threonine-protein kinase PRKY [Hylaeus volcanicus]
MDFLGKINMFKKIFTNNSYNVSNTLSSLKPVNKKYTDTVSFESSLKKKPDYILIKTLGTGSFGRVFLGKDVNNPARNPVAIKRLVKHMLIRQKQVDHVISERAILSCVSHPFLVKMYTTFKDAHYLYIVLEFVPGGEFFTFLRKSRRFENSVACFYASQITLIFEYLHSKNIVYRDLKPENLLIAQDGYLKLTDFGFSKLVDSRTYTLCGTPEYIAPEILTYKGHGKPVDWWTLGILIYEMLVGHPPFIDDEPLGIYRKILDGKIIFPRYFDKHAKALVKRLLTHNLGKRYGNLLNGINDIKFHAWFANIDWDYLLNKKITPPHVPEIHELDATFYFENYPETEDVPPVVTGDEDPFNDW